MTGWSGAANRAAPAALPSTCAASVAAWDERMRTSTWNAVATDVSDGGLMLESCDPLIPGARCRVRIEDAGLPSNGALGRVLRCNYSPAVYLIAIARKSNLRSAVA